MSSDIFQTRHDRARCQNTGTNVNFDASEHKRHHWFGIVGAHNFARMLNWALSVFLFYADGLEAALARISRKTSPGKENARAILTTVGNISADWLQP